MDRSRTRSVLFLQGSVGFGGSKQSLLDAVRVLRAAGYRPVVACPGPGWLTEELARSQSEFRILPFYAWRKWLERPRVIPAIRRHWLPALADTRIDLVHSNEFWWAPHAIYLARRLGVPAVVHLRDGHHTLKKARQYRLSRADRVLAVSSELRSRFVRDRGLFEKTEVVFNGHDPAAVRFAGDLRALRREMGIPLESFVVGNAGRLCERKNQRLLLEALAHLKQETDLPPVRLLFAGEADEPYRREMERDIHRLGLRKEVQFLGPVGDMSRFYAAIDLLAHCARREGLPRVIPEAMLAGRPVVATEAEGVRDALSSDRVGLVVPPEDARALASAISALRRDPNGCARRVLEARRRAEVLFSLGALRENLVRIYQQLTHSRGVQT